MADKKLLEAAEELGWEKAIQWHTFLLRSTGSKGRLDLRGANMKDAELTRVSLQDADLSGADLSKANLRNVNLRNADLSGANLTGADLSQADATGANFTGAILARTNVQGVLFEKALMRDTFLEKARNVGYANWGGARGIGPRQTDLLMALIRRTLSR